MIFLEKKSLVTQRRITLSVVFSILYNVIHNFVQVCLVNQCVHCHQWSHFVQVILFCFQILRWHRFLELLIVNGNYYERRRYIQNPRLSSIFTHLTEVCGKRILSIICSNLYDLAFPDLRTLLTFIDIKSSL